jgi:hypothetical protein
MTDDKRFFDKMTKCRLAETTRISASGLLGKIRI